MTLVACFGWGPHPILIADTMVSSFGEPLEQLPLVESMPTWNPNQRRPTSLTQKLIIASDRIAIGLAGSANAARAFAAFVSGETRRRPLRTPDEFQKLFDAFPIEKRTELEGYLLWYEAPGSRAQIIPIGGAAFLPGSTDREYALAAGSGADAFREHFPAVLRCVGDGRRSQDEGIAVALSFCSYVLAQQALNGDGLSDGWGGCFEVASFWNGRFTRVNNIRFISRSWRETDRGLELRDFEPNLIQCYERGLLLSSSPDFAFVIGSADPAFAYPTGTVSFNIERCRWLVVTLHNASTNDISFGVRKVTSAHSPDWRITNDEFSISTEKIREIAEKRFLFQNF